MGIHSWQANSRVSRRNIRDPLGFLLQDDESPKLLPRNWKKVSSEERRAYIRDLVDAYIEALRVYCFVMKVAPMPTEAMVTACMMRGKKFTRMMESTEAAQVGWAKKCIAREVQARRDNLEEVSS